MEIKDLKPLDMKILEKMISISPEIDAVGFIWNILRGSWTDAANNSFVSFAVAEGKYLIGYGRLNSEWRGFGQFVSGKQTGKYSIEIIAHFPEITGEEVMGPLPAANIKFEIDMSGIAGDYEEREIQVSINQSKPGRGSIYVFDYRVSGSIYAYFSSGSMEQGEFMYAWFSSKYDLTVEFLAGELANWSGLDFKINVSASESAVTVDWAAGSDLFSKGGCTLKGGQSLSSAEMKAWFMLDSLWYTIKENFNEIDVYYTMDGGKELIIPAIEYPEVFSREIPYMGSDFYYAHQNGDSKFVKWILPMRIPVGYRFGMNLYHQSENIMFPGDDKAKICLYVCADKDADGNFIFDDGQDWMLALTTPSGAYMLLPRQYVQLGIVSYTAFIDIKGIFHVLITVTGGAGHKIIDCLFYSAKKAFKSMNIYEEIGINRVADSEALIYRIN